jgi:hypothetical protein
MLFTIDPTEYDLISRSPENSDGDIQNRDISYNYELVDLNIVNKRGDVIPLLEVFSSVEFTEDLFNNFVFGNITIIDPSAGDEKFVFSGGEEVHIKIRKTYASDGISDILVSRDDFVITKIKGYVDEEVSEYSKYTFEIATKAFVKSFKKRVYKSWPGLSSYNKILNEIFEEYLAVPGADNIAIEEIYQGTQKNFLIPGYTPHKSMQFIMKRAGAGTQNAFLFYDRFLPSYYGGRKYNHFVMSLDTLRKQTPTKTIVYSPTLDNFRGLDSGSVLRASSFSRGDGFSHFENMSAGLYNSKITEHDLLYQTIKENTYNIFEDDETKMNLFLAADRLNLMTNFDTDEHPAERFVPASGVRAEFVESYIAMLRVRMQTIQTVIDGGNNMLGVGDVVNFKCRSKIFDEHSNSRYIEDKVFSGKYLITAAKHYIDRNSYQKRLELSRESLNINLDSIFSFTSDLIQD